MPRVSRRLIKKDIAIDLRECFSFLIATLQTSSQIEGFFHTFLTREEKVMLMKRLMLYLMLQRGYKTSEIATILGLSRETIRVHKNHLEESTIFFQDMIQKLAKRQKTKTLLRKIEKLLTPLDLAMRAKGDINARVKLIHGNWYND